MPKNNGGRVYCAIEIFRKMECDKDTGIQRPVYFGKSPIKLDLDNRRGTRDIAY